MDNELHGVYTSAAKELQTTNINSTHKTYSTYSMYNEN